MTQRSRCLCAAVVAPALLTSIPASAHVKWFAPFDTSAKPLSTFAVVDDLFVVFSLVRRQFFVAGYVPTRGLTMRWMPALGTGSLCARLPRICCLRSCHLFGAVWATGLDYRTQITMITFIPWLSFHALSTGSSSRFYSIDHCPIRFAMVEYWRFHY